MSQRVIDKINEHGAANHVMLTLGSNKLVFAQNERWIIENSDLDVAAAEILRLAEENENLKRINSELSSRLEASNDTVEEASKLNDITMHMLTDERRQNMLLSQEVEAYKEELKKSFTTIVQLRKHVND
mmetsp:Transcript_6642/g.10887  ORF Transcript_6642/g.10887 Transcript_6642/m.10887 type:complete len:129 (-) Transcript_6642:217-603(-)